MNIGLDGRVLLDKKYSGVSEFTHELYKNIFRIDKINSYKLFLNSFSGGRSINIQGDYETCSYKIPNKFFNYFLLRLLNYPKLDKLTESDIYYLPNLNFYSLSSKCRKVITIHDLSFIKYPEFYSPRGRFWHKIIQVKKTLNTFDKIVAVSENTKEDIVNVFNIDSEKVNVVHLGVSGKYKKLDDTELCEYSRKKNLPNKFILYLGNIEPRKNVDGIIQGFECLKKDSRYRDYKLIIAGQRAWRFEKTIDTWKKSKFKNDIIFLGYVSDHDKVRLYNLASLFVYPSFYEGFGLPPLEAMKCGTPVISSISSSIPEVLESSALLVDPYNYREIGEGMESILANIKLKNSYTEAGVVQAAKYDWERTAIRYIRLFEELKNS